MPTPEFSSDFSREGRITPARTNNGSAPVTPAERAHDKDDAGPVSPETSIELSPTVAASAEALPFGDSTPPVIKAVCVYCSSSNALGENYKQLARDTAKEIARHGLKLVYGGGDVGLMGLVARGVKANGGHVTGIIPTFIKQQEDGLLHRDEVI